MTMPNIKIVSDREIRYMSETRGLRVTREQIIEVDGKQFLSQYWTDWESGKLHHVDSNPI